MKLIHSTIRSALLCSAFVICHSSFLHAGTFVHETTNEFSASGDFNGDSRGDVLVIDKATGLYRIGYGTATTGLYNLAEGRASGMTNVSGVAVGKLNGVTAESFAVTSPAQNRALILSPSTSGYTEPKAVQDAGLGPVIMGAIDITGGASPTAEDDLGVIASLNLTNQFELRQIRSNTGAWSFLRSDNITDVTVSRGNPIVPHSGSPAIFAYIRDDGATNSFHAWSLAGTSATEVLTGSTLPDGSQFICGLFDGANADVMAWVPGQNTIIVGRVTAAGPSWVFSSVTPVNAGLPIAQLLSVNSPSGQRVLVRYQNGSVAIWSYTLAGGFASPVAITPTGATGTLSGVVPMPGNSLQLLYSSTPGGPTSSMITFNNGGSGWTQVGSTVLPGLKPLSIYANVLLLESPIFRSDFVDLVRSYQVGDWVTAAAIGAGPFTVTASAATFGGSTQGIGATSPQVVGSVPTAPGGTAVNQMHPQFSIFSFNSNLGPVVDAVTIAPSPGTYTTAQQITFSGLIAGTTVYLRMNGNGSFQAWNPANPPWLTRTTTVEYYASRAGGASQTQTAQYTFNVSAALQDKDGDGVPDFVEIAHGMDPNSGSDTDADGFTDADELAAGTNPNDALSKPATQPVARDAMLVDVRLRLLDVAGATVAHGATGSEVTVHDPFGNSLGSGLIGTGGISAQFGRVNTVGVDPAMGFLVVRSSTHFSTTPAGTNEPRGRELAGIIPALEPEVWSWATANGVIGAPTTWGWGGVNWQAGSTNWNAGTGDMQGADANWTLRQLDPLWDSSAVGTYSAAGWLTEYQAAMNRGAQPYAEVTLTPVTSLASVIVGKMVGDLLTQRNPTLTIDGTTLSFDSSLASSFKGLRREDATYPTATVVRLIALLHHIDDQLSGTDAGANALRKLARDVYALHNALLPDNLAALPMPLDALGTYVSTGALPAEYLPGLSLGAIEQAAALTKLNTITSTAPARVRVTPTVYVSSTFINGLSLVNDSAATPKYLVDDKLARVILPTTAEAPAGTPMLADAYNDIPQVGGYAGLEIVSLSLSSLPFVVDQDTDGDLLADSWELYHFGTLAYGGNANRDGSLYSLAQEYLEGTDPRCNTISPTVGPIALQFQDFQIIGDPIYQLLARWPARYSSAVNVAFETSDDLTIWDTLTPLPAFEEGAGFFFRSFSIDRPRRFFRPHASLRR